MNIYTYNKMKNMTVFICWIIINIVLTLAYVLEFFKGNRTLEYVIWYCAFVWIPCMVNYAISLIIGRSNLNIKYGIALGYIIFYTYTMFTSNNIGTFCYIIPMLCVLLLYNDIHITDWTTTAAILVNIIDIANNINNHKEAITPEIITFYEIQIACLLLVLIFLHRTNIVLIYGNTKMLELNEEMNKDELTDVYNRHFLTDYISDTFNNIEVKSVSLAIIDIDNFKSINDTYGHRFGDVVLVKTSEILKGKILPLKDTYIVRIGGDEFIIISSKVSPEELYELCCEICEDVNNTIIQYGTINSSYTVSIGVANTVLDKCKTYNKLYVAADKMLYTVKNNGKSSVAISNHL